MNTLGIHTPDQKHLDKQEISVVENKQHEFKFVGSTKKVAGHTLFSFNTETKELKRLKSRKARPTTSLSSSQHTRTKW